LLETLQGILFLCEEFPLIAPGKVTALCDGCLNFTYLKRRKVRLRSMQSLAMLCTFCHLKEPTVCAAKFCEAFAWAKTKPRLILCGSTSPLSLNRA